MLDADTITLDNSWLRTDQPATKGDDALYVRFYLRPKLNLLKTHGGEKEVIGPGGMRQTVKVEGAGRPIYDDVEYVEIARPGDRLERTDMPVTNKERARFRKHYQAFKDGQKEITSGTPLERWPLIQAHQVEELRHFNVRSVEQLALMPDGNIPSVGNISRLKKQAVDFLEVAKGNAPSVQLRVELEKRDGEIETLKRQMAELISAQQETNQKKTDAEPKPQPKKQ